MGPQRPFAAGANLPPPALRSCCREPVYQRGGVILVSTPGLRLHPQENPNRGARPAVGPARQRLSRPVLASGEASQW